jgi:malonyl-CoA/methylmalonyl-CoA synthetase
LAAAIERNQASVLLAVPTQYERLVGDAALRPESFSTLRLAVSGSAPLPISLGRKAEALLGQIPLERYGSTEAGLDVSNPYEHPRRLGTVGLPLPGIEVAIVDEQFALRPQDEVGEIVVRGPQVFSGYEGPAIPAEDAFFKGGWFRTGDLGHVREAGYLTICGRLKELIITGGMNVSPREVELVLEHLPDVDRAVVIGVPSERWGEEVVAFVVPRRGASPTPDDLVSAAREQLAPYKCPKRILLRDTLPQDQYGKVRRSDLAPLATEVRA